jgi:uncharacterized protein (TIGR01777 family)
MGIVHQTVVAAAIDEVFDWHARPGAMRRLVPPWQPLSVVAEAASLRDGRAVLSLPGGIRWAAQHVPQDYLPPYRFVDRLDSMPLSAVLSWRHEHRFADLGDATEVLDRVQTAVPERLLRATFRYRTRQLADDLDAQRRARELGLRPLTIAVTGSAGTVGSALVPYLTTAGHRVIRLVRQNPREAGERRWDPADPDSTLLDGVDAVLHLAGAAIAGRFTAAHRRSVRDSRIGPTRRLAELAARTGVAVFVCASAIGYYGADREDETLDEKSPPGTGFLAELVSDWEDAAAAGRAASTRVVQVRTGLVQTPRGGLLRLQRPIFAAGLGGRLGSGNQWLSWIAVDDLLDIYHRAIVDRRLAGPINAVAPDPVRGKDFAATLARVLHRPGALAVPTPALELILGTQGTHEFALAGQRVVPRVLTARGHRFRWPVLDPALRHLLGRPAADEP